MTATGYSFVELLSSAENFECVITPEVAAAADRLDLEVDRLTLAGACLGSSVEAVDRLVAAGFLPDALPETERHELCRRLETTPERLREAILSKRDHVVGFLGLPVPHEDPSVPVPATASPGYPLFAHQRRALRRLNDLLEAGRDRMVLHMPTGSGKTRTMMNFICDRLRYSDQGAVLWLASTQELLEQAAHEFARAWSYLGNRTVPITTAWGGSQWTAEAVTDGLLVASPQTMHQRAKSLSPTTIGRLGRNLQLIVFDEAHQALAETYRDVIERLAASGQPITPIVGLTATPGRTFTRSDEDDELATFFGHTKVMLDTTAEGGPDNPVDYLISHGYLANADFVLLGELPEEDAGDLMFHIQDDVRPEMAVNDYIDVVASATLDLVTEGHRRILVFAASVELARILASLIRAAGINAHSIDASTETAVRDTAIREYKTRTNDPRVLVNHGVLTTGFDAPQTSAAVIARPTRSLVLYSQMAGRAIRGPRAGGNEYAKVITVVDPNVPAFGSIAEAFTHWNMYWEDQND